MINFSTFLMEEPLEVGRFSSGFNALESGGPPLLFGQLLDLIARNRNSSMTTENGVSSSSPRDLLQEVAALSLADSPNHGREDLRRHVARLHPGAVPDNVLITTGTSEALLLVFLALRPKKVAVVLPGFQLLTELITGLGSQIIGLPMTWNQDAQPDPDLDLWLQILKSEKPDVILFNHPHNPSGYVFESNFLAELSRCAAEMGSKIVGDEHYRFLTANRPLGDTLWQQPEPVMRQSDPCNIVTGSFIKCLGVPGLRIGWCVAPLHVISQMQNIKNYTTHTVNPLSEWAAEAVLRDPELGAFKTTREVWQRNIQQLALWQKQGSQWLVTPPHGGWVTCLTHRDFPNRRHAIEQALVSAGCHMLDLKLFEWERFGQPQCQLTKRGGFRMGLGMEAEAFGGLLKSISGCS